MESELVQALTANIEVAAAEAQHAATVLCWILGPLVAVSVVAAIVCAIAGFADDSGNPAFPIIGICCGVVGLLAAAGFLCELSTAMAPHAYILTHLIRSGS